LNIGSLFILSQSIKQQRVIPMKWKSMRMENTICRPVGESVLYSQAAKMAKAPVGSKEMTESLHTTVSKIRQQPLEIIQ